MPDFGLTPVTGEADPGLRGRPIRGRPLTGPGRATSPQFALASGCDPGRFEARPVGPIPLSASTPNSGASKEIRTPVICLEGRGPRPLDDTRVRAPRAGAHPLPRPSRSAVSDGHSVRDRGCIPEWLRPGSNRRPPDFQSGALPTAPQNRASVPAKKATAYLWKPLGVRASPGTRTQKPPIKSRMRCRLR